MNSNASIPDLGSAFTAQERQTVARAILQRCDASVGLADGMVQATQACLAAFDLMRDVPTCQGARDGSCLTPAQKSLVAQIHAGGKTRPGQPIYSAFPYDPGLADSNWAEWKFVNALIRDPLAVSTVFTVPPMPTSPMTADIEVLLNAIAASNDIYRESGLALMSPPGQEQPDNLRALRARGAKMMLYHGVSDAIFSAEDTRQRFDRLDISQGGRASDFARYFPVPSMNHCSASPATDQFDLLTPLVHWVEEGVAPQAVMAQARGAGNAGGANNELPADWAANRTRPLCAYPTVARYRGQGSTEDARNFSCQ